MCPDIDLGSTVSKTQRNQSSLYGLLYNRRQITPTSSRVTNPFRVTQQSRHLALIREYYRDTSGKALSVLLITNQPDVQDRFTCLQKKYTVSRQESVFGNPPVSYQYQHLIGEISTGVERTIRFFFSRTCNKNS